MNSFLDGLSDPARQIKRTDPAHREAPVYRQDLLSKANAEQTLPELRRLPRSRRIGKPFFWVDP